MGKDIWKIVFFTKWIFKFITKQMSPVNVQVQESTAASPAAKMKYSSTKILQQRDRLEKTEREGSS